MNPNDQQQMTADAPNAASVPNAATGAPTDAQTATASNAVPATPSAPTDGNAAPQSDANGNANGVRAIDQKEVADAIAKYREDPKWRKIFDEAPQGAKFRIALNFWVSANAKNPNFNRAAYLSLRAALEKDLVLEDLEYLVDTATNDASKAHYRQLMLALPDEEPNGDGEQKGVANAQ